MSAVYDEITMLSLAQERAGAPLTLVDLAIPQPGPGQVRIKVEAIGLNPVDADLVASGNSEWSWPHVPILDAAGVVDAIGDDVTEWRAGDRVAAHGDLRATGAAAQFAIFGGEVLARIPDGVSFIEAAAAPCAGMTAYQAVHRRLDVRSGQSILITGATGGVGGFAVQLASQAGAHVIALASHGHEDVMRLGASEVIDYRAADATEQVLAANDGRGLDAIVDAVSSASATRHLAMLRYAGGIACIAGLPDLHAIASFGISPSVHEIALGAAYSHGEDRHRRDLSVMLTDLLGRVADGRLVVPIAQVIGLDGIDAALTGMRERHTRGKIVAVVKR
ncbi:zinc-binding dehydrogenase [Microbacterium sp. A93]|uniref:zinc-binding dehydrogenase n=1 Tax=Microbacterium sp. A93 TaxID=3450716 RepID=UPI003F429C8F